MRYLKTPELPVYIEALKWDPKKEDLPKWFNEAIIKGRMTVQHGRSERVQLAIITPSGVRVAQPGSMIILFENGTVDYLGITDFEMQYEEVKS